MAEQGITCPRCGMTSHHPEDVKHRYCGNCDAFHDPPETIGNVTSTDPERAEKVVQGLKDSFAEDGYHVQSLGPGDFMLHREPMYEPELRVVKHRDETSCNQLRGKNELVGMLDDAGFQRGKMKEIGWIDCLTCKGKGTDPKKRKRRCPNVMCRNGQVPDGDQMCDCECHDKRGIMHVMPCCEWSGLARPKRA